MPRRHRLDGGEIGSTESIPSRPVGSRPALAPGGELITLRDAGEYIAALPKAVHDRPGWQTAAEALLLVVERGWPSRIGIMRALNHGKPAPDSGPRRKPAKRYRVIR